MKMEPTGRLYSRWGLGLVAVAAAILLAGCVATSVYPFYTEKDLVFDPALLGRWVDANTTNQHSAYVKVAPLGEKGYWLTVFTKDETNGSELHLFRVEQHLFMDVFSTNRSLDYVPTHQVSKIIQMKPILQAASLNYDWLATLLKKHPRAIRHIVVPDKPGDDGGRIVLTADTRELQRFIMKYLNDTNAWNKPSDLKRLE